MDISRTSLVFEEVELIERPSGRCAQCFWLGYPKSIVVGTAPDVIEAYVLILKVRTGLWPLVRTR